MKIYAYARVSARDQNLERQLSALKRFGVPARSIFAEKKSGKDFCRGEYLKLLARLKRGDLLVVKSLDRLGRNYEQILAEWQRITKLIGADILVLDTPLLDTRCRTGALVGRFIADIVLQILSFVAENERESIKARQAEGIRLAKARGVKFGRPRLKLSKEFIAAAEKYLKKDIALGDALNMLKISKATFFRRLLRLKGQR